MSFEPVEIEARPFGSSNPLREGECSIAKTGHGLFHGADLSIVQITDQAALLADPGTLRLALRVPHLPEDFHSVVKVSPAKNGRGRVHVPLSAGIRRLGLTPRGVGGARYELSTKDNLLIIQLVNGETGKAKRAR